MSTASYIDPRDLRVLGNMRVRARSVVEGVITGLHRNPHRGSSVEFAEYKEYAPGDDIRHIDWRAYARVDRYYVKQFEDETNVRAYMLLDSSGSMSFQFEDSPTRLFYGSTLAAALAFVLLRQGDAPGLMTFDDRPGHWLPPSGRRSQIEDICRVLDEAPGKGRTSIDAAFARIAERVTRRSMVLLISDMLDTAEDMMTLARVLRRRGMEVVVFHVMDRAEFSLPFEGLTVFEGLEDDGELLVDPDDIREAYQVELRKHLDWIQHQCLTGDIEYFRTFTDQPMERVILRFLMGRQRGRTAVAR